MYQASLITWFPGLDSCVIPLPGPIADDIYRHLNFDQMQSYQDGTAKVFVSEEG